MWGDKRVYNRDIITDIHGAVLTIVNAVVIKWLVAECIRRCAMLVWVIYR